MLIYLHALSDLLRSAPTLEDLTIHYGGPERLTHAHLLADNIHLQSVKSLLILMEDLDDTAIVTFYKKYSDTLVSVALGRCEFKGSSDWSRAVEKLKTINFKSLKIFNLYHCVEDRLGLEEDGLRYVDIAPYLRSETNENPCRPTQDNTSGNDS